MTVKELIELLNEQKDLSKNVKIVSDLDSGSYLCLDEGNGKVRIITSL